MRPKVILVVIAVVVIGATAYGLLGKRPDRGDLNTLRRALSQRETEQNSRQQRQAEFDTLARQGKGQQVPDDLVTKRDPSGYWFVGKPGRVVGVEVPFRPGNTPTPPPELEPVHENPGFLGAQACQACHPKVYETFIETAHHLTSRPASDTSLAGSFDPGHNRMETSDDDVSFEMVKRDGKHYQRTSFFDWQFEIPIDIVTGSAKMAQTFVYWHGSRLYQLNVSYLTEKDAWINSPGFVDGDAAYARTIGRRCLECHTTYIDFRGPPNRFTHGTLIYGISCERCHGPGREHVEYHQQHPDETIAKFVTVPSDLPREPQLDVCSQCHSGVTELKGEPYQFRPGDRLSDHYDPPADPNDGGSVHTSNQAARLALSGCFTESDMTCVDCHNPHRKERGDMVLFSERCLKCHQTSECGMESKLGERLSENCIDCHMPSRASDKLHLDTAEGRVFPALRDHNIRVDLKATEDYLKSVAK